MSTYEIELNNTYANQEFDVIIDKIENSIHIELSSEKTGQYNSLDNEPLLVLMMSIFVNNQQIGIPFICYPNQPIIPYQYMVEKVGGNFVFETVDNNYPNFENFGDTCKLYFITLDRIQALNL